MTQTAGAAQEFNTLEAQREAAEAYVRSQGHAGWTTLPERYDDGGYSGANLDRPALRQLLADIEVGRIDCVLVYKIDRPSRSPNLQNGAATSLPWHYIEVQGNLLLSYPGHGLANNNLQLNPGHDQVF